jgi:hypothetical protein
MTAKLFAVTLGGRAPKGNTELHDVVFVAGETIDATYDQLLAKWFGQPQRLHIDSWVAVETADGHRVSLGKGPGSAKRLYFVNLGTYADDRFAELHANGLFVAESPEDAKIRAKTSLLKDWPGEVHTDDVIDVAESLGAPIGLEPTGETADLHPVNGYHPLPQDVIASFVRSLG